MRAGSGHKTNGRLRRRILAIMWMVNTKTKEVNMNRDGWRLLIVAQDGWGLQ